MFAAELVAPALCPANPVFPGADPHVAVFGETCWACPTCATHREAQFRAFDFVAYSSKDLVG